ncbi:COPII_coat_assembly_protein_sec16_-_putative [Leishmania infantum]|nr:COPII_coat_assembly_protein_sec16_-_putative [Leishmania infantum]SUZ43631.1 COPII_coat_assembly_protein_sec16_-_putative [Leishmania infantum]
MHTMLEHTEPEAPSHPPPAAFSSPSAPAAAPAGPLLATRVSGVALGRPASSRNSSNGRQSPRDLSEFTGHWVPSRISKEYNTFLAEVNSPSETAAAAAVVHHSRPSSRGSSILEGVAAASAAALEAGGHRTPSAPGHAPNISSGLRRSVPAFLQPGGGDSVAQRTVRAASSRVDSTTTASRGRKLLEAALTARGARHAPLRHTSFSSLAAHPQQQSSASVQKSQGAPVRGKEAGAAPAEHSAGARLEMRDQWSSAPTHRSSGNDGSAATDASLLVPGLATLCTGSASLGTGYSFSSRSVRPTMGGNGDFLTCDTALLSNARAGDPKGESASRDGPLQADGPLRRADAEHVSSSGHAGDAAASSHPSAPPRNPNGLIAGGMTVSGAEAPANAHTHNPRFDARGSLPRPADEPPQSDLSADDRSASRQEHRSAFMTGSDPTLATTTLVNPFRAMTRKSGGGGDTAASPAPPPTVSREQLSCQQQQWQDPQQQPRQKLLLHDAPHSGFHSGAPPSAPSPSYPDAEANLPEKLSSPKDITTTEDAGTAGPPLPPLPQQQQPLFAAANGDTTTATAPVTGFTTPRGGGAGSVPRAPPQRQQLPLPPSNSSSSNVPPNMSRGLYAASPYVRDEDARAVVDESPIPQRPLPFDSVPQLEATPMATAEQDEGEFGATDSGALDYTHNNGAHAVRRSMQDDLTEEKGAAGQYQPPPPPRNGLHAAPPLSPAQKRGAANPFSAILTQVHPKVLHASQQQPPPQPTHEPQAQEQRQEGPTGPSAHLIPQPSGPPPPVLPTRTISKSSALPLLPNPGFPCSTNISESPLSKDSTPALKPSPRNVADTWSCHDCPSSSNPFLEPDENFLFTPSNGLLPDAANTSTNSTSRQRPHQALMGSLDSVQSAPAHHEPPPPSKDDAAPPMASNSTTAPLLNFAGDGGAPGTTTARTPGGATLVNPFSKSAPNSNCYLSATTVSINGSGALSGGASLTGSFAGGAVRKKSRRSGAPCFAIFVGGATLLPGVQGDNSSERRGFPCIAACFNNPISWSPLIANSARSPLVQPITSASSRTGSVRTTSLSGAARANTSPVPRPLGVGALGGNIGICLSFCSVTEALTARGSMVDRKGIRGTEYGRRYVRALTDAVLPCALLADQWATGDAATGAVVAGVMDALKGCVPAPLGEVVEVMLMDALPQKDGGGFVWKDNGGRRLAELLTAAAQADARRRAATARSRSATAHPAAGASATSATEANDALMAISPLNPVTSAARCDSKERAAALRRVEDLLCTGQRVEAVETALEAHLHAHALLISMMCPTKDLYLRSVQAVMQQELSVTSPLAHAYSMFNEMPLPPLVPPPSKADEEDEGATALGEGRSISEAAQHQEQQHKRQQQMFLRNQEMLQQTWRRHAAILLANFTRHSGNGLLQLATTLQQVNLVVEAHTCLLLLHLTPLGMAGPARAGAEPLPPASSLSPECVEDLLPRPDQRQVMEEIRRRIGVVGGTYHPTRGCRASFLTPVTTLLTQLVQLVSARLDARAPPLSPPESAEPPVPFHGLPHGQPRSDIGYRMMQVLWLRELGLGKESAQALHALLQRMPPPLAFSLRVPPRTLNELVYLFGGVPPPSPQQPPDALDGAAAAARGESVPESEATTQQPSPNAYAGSPSHSREVLPQNADDEADKAPSTSRSTLTRSTSEVHHTGPLPQRNPQQRQAPTPQHLSLLNRALLPSSPPGTATSLLTRDQRAAALQPLERPEPPSDGKPGNASAKAATAPAAGKLKQPAPRRSRSLDVLRNFFRRGHSEAAGEEKSDEAKPMHLDTEKPPAFDPVTGRWLFEETEEEKRLRELAKAGPPKMAPKAAGPTSAPVASAAAWGPSPSESAPLQRPGTGKEPQPGNARPGPGAPTPVHAGGGMLAPRPSGGAPAIAGRDAPPPTMAGRGAARPGGRPQYVDMFNTN